MCDGLTVMEEAQNSTIATRSRQILSQARVTTTGDPAEHSPWLSGVEKAQKDRGCRCHVQGQPYLGIMYVSYYERQPAILVKSWWFKRGGETLKLKYQWIEAEGEGSIKHKINPISQVCYAGLACKPRIYRIWGLQSLRSHVISLYQRKQNNGGSCNLSVSEA